MKLNRVVAGRKNIDVGRGERCVFLFVLFCFVAKAIYFALNIHRHVFPDEISWFGMVELFSRSYLFPVDSPESYPLGLVTHVPNLYSFLLGKILTLNVLGVSDLLFVRLINVGLGACTIFFAWRLICLLLSNVGGRLLSLVMLANTVMFTFIAGAVNYDNLSTLLAVLSLYYLILFRRQRTMKIFLWFMIFLFAGILSKNVFLPYAVGLISIFLVTERQIIFSPPGKLWKNFQYLSRYDYGKVVVVLILLVASLNLYMGNKIRYGRLLPAMNQVLAVEDCLQNRLYARGYAAEQLKGGKVSMLGAQRLALQVRDPGDRAFAMQLLRTVQQERSGAKIVREGRLAYSWEWFEFMTARLYGIAAHLSLYKSAEWLWGYYTVFLVGLVLLINRFAREGLAGLGGVLFIFFFYTIILMQVVNYGGYKSSGFVGLALTGRYLFPVIVPFYILLAHGLMSRMPAWWQWGVGGAISGFFMYSEFPWFLLNVTPNWYF